MALESSFEANPLEPGLLFRLGAWVEVDGRISWFGSEARGCAPSSCYLLTTDSACLLIDSGLPFYQEPLINWLRANLGGRELSVLLTRPREYDTMGNLWRVIAEFPVSSVSSRLSAKSLFQVGGPVEATTPGGMPAVTAVDWLAPGPGTAVDIGTEGRRLKLVAPPLDTLSTFWVYDAETKTMFTSDSFGYVVRPASGGSPVVTENDAFLTTVEDVRDQLVAKFHWLVDADRIAIAEAIGEIFAAHDVETIAPVNGCVLRGRELVERQLELVLEALEAIGRGVQQSEVVHG